MTFHYYPPQAAGTGMKPGTLLLTEALEDLVGFDIGPSYNRRCVQQCGSPVPVGARTCGRGHGISHHAECTAVDVMTIYPSVHRLVVDWCLGPVGQAYEVQEIVTGYPPTDVPIIGPARWTVDTGWRPYSGGPSAHRDHVHISQTPHAAARTTPPEIPQEDDIMFRLIRPAGFYDIACLGGVAFHAQDPDVVNDLVDHNLVVGLTPGARNYDQAAVVLLPKTWAQIVGKQPAAARPAGEV